MTNEKPKYEAFNQACADVANAAARLREMRPVALHFTGPKKLVIAVLRKTIREASLVCAALERMGHEAYPFGWSDPEKNASMEGLTFDLIDADEANIMRFESSELPSAVVAARLAMRSDINDHQALNRWVVLRDLRAHLRRHAVEAPAESEPGKIATPEELDAAIEAARESFGGNDGVFNTAGIQGALKRNGKMPTSSEVERLLVDHPRVTRLGDAHWRFDNLALQLLHDDFALTLEEQTCILDALGCIDRKKNALGAEHAVRDDVETILAHISELQHDAIRWQESRRPENTMARDVADEALDKARERGLGRFRCVTTPLGGGAPEKRDANWSDPVRITRFGQLWSLRVPSEADSYGVVVAREVGGDGVLRWKVCPIAEENDIASWCEGVERISTSEWINLLSARDAQERAQREAANAPKDSIPKDSIPKDSIPKDSIPKCAIQAGDIVRIKGTTHPDERVFAVGRIEHTAEGLSALLVWTDAHDGVGTKLVPVAALEVVS